MQQYKEFNVKTLCLSIIQRWRIILIITLVFSIMIGCYGVFVKSRSDLKPVDLEIIEKKFTQEEKTNVNDAINLINGYKASYNLQRDYISNSIYQKIDPFDVKVCDLKFYVDNNHEVSYPVISDNDNLVALVQSYASLAYSDEILDEMVDKIGDDIKPAYFAEVLEVDTEDQEYGVFTVRVCSYSDEQLSKMSTIIKNFLLSKENQYEDCSLQLVSESNSSIIDTKIAETQQKNLQTLTSISEQITKVENAFDGDRLLYIKAMVHDKAIIETNYGLYFLIGILVGLICSVFVIVVKLFASSKLHTVDEIEKMYGINPLAACKFGDTSKLTKLDKWILLKKGIECNPNLSLISAKISIVAKKMNADQVCLLATSREVLNNFDGIDLEDIKLDRVCNLNDEVEMKIAANSKSVVLIEELEKSKIDDIYQRIKNIKQNDISIIGIIAVA